jgi:hypothetical protein
MKRLTSASARASCPESPVSPIVALLRLRSILFHLAAMTFSVV